MVMISRNPFRKPFFKSHILAYAKADASIFFKCGDFFCSGVSHAPPHKPYCILKKRLKTTLIKITRTTRTAIAKYLTKPASLKDAPKTFIATAKSP